MIQQYFAVAVMNRVHRQDKVCRQRQYLLLDQLVWLEKIDKLLSTQACLSFQTLLVALIKDITATFRLCPDLFIKIFLLMFTQHKIKTSYAEVLYYMNSEALLQLSRLHGHCDNSLLL